MISIAMISISRAFQKSLPSLVCAFLIWNQSNLGFAESTDELNKWPALTHWTSAINEAMAESSDEPSNGAHLDRVSYLLTAADDIRAARSRLKLTEGTLPAVGLPTQRYIGGGDEVCESIGAENSATLLEVIRHRLGVRKRALDAHMSLDESQEVALEIRASAKLGKVRWCESVLLDDSEHDEPVYLHAFTIGSGRPRQKTAMIVVETRW